MGDYRVPAYLPRRSRQRGRSLARTKDSVTQFRLVAGNMPAPYAVFAAAVFATGLTDGYAAL